MAEPAAKAYRPWVGGGLLLATVCAVVIIGVLPRALRRHATRGTDGAPESCLDCHGATTGLSAAHDPARIGCAACHLGSPARSDADGAHRGMVLVPGNLDRISETCGRAGCHATVAARVVRSPMNAARGIVAVDRYVFGEQPTPDGKTTIAELGDSLADSHLGQLCANCHLGHPKDKPGPITELSRGGGCVACHLADSPRRTAARDDPERFVHPGLTLRISDDACFGCHSRSARIALNYAGWYEIAEPPPRAPATAVQRRLLDGRPLRRAPTDDVHHARGMACIDCHTAQETMGDGSEPLHEEQATHVRCTTCHRPAAGPPPRMATRNALVAETAVTVRGRPELASWNAFLVEERSGEVLTNARPEADGSVEITGKLDGRRHVARPPSSQCYAIAGHQRLSCQSCHSAWAPRCVGCHTQREPLDPAHPTPRWSEYDVAPEAAPPSLGLLTRDGTTTIEPFVPGMLLTLNTEPPSLPPGAPMPRSAAELITPETRRFSAFAYTAPHTTTRAARSCASCHLEPPAIDWGVANPDSTRTSARPLDAATVERVRRAAVRGELTSQPRR